MGVAHSFSGISAFDLFSPAPQGPKRHVAYEFLADEGVAHGIGKSRLDVEGREFLQDEARGICRNFLVPARGS